MGKGFRLRWQPTSVGSVIAESMTTWTQVVNGSVKLNHIFLKASKGDTTFDFKITSPTGNDILVRNDIAGTLSEASELVMRGLYVLTISNVKNGEGANVDDSFEGEFTVQELKNK